MVSLGFDLMAESRVDKKRSVNHSVCGENKGQLQSQGLLNNTSCIVASVCCVLGLLTVSSVPPPHHCRSRSGAR